MAKKPPPLTLEEENEQKAKYAGMLKADIEAAANAIGTQKMKSAQASGDLSAKLEIFEKAGGVKRAMKWAKILADMEPADQADFWRALEGYSRALGVFDQIDMFDQEREIELNKESVAIASSQSPEIGPEPLTH